MKFRLFIILILVIASGFSFNTHSQVKEPGSVQAKSLNERLTRALSSRQKESAKNIADSLEKLISGDKEIRGLELAGYLYRIGLSKSIFGNAAGSIPWFEKALATLGQDSTGYLWARIYYNLGWASDNLGDYIKSDLCFSKSNSYTLKQRNNSNDLLVDYSALSTANINLRNFRKALDYCNKAIEVIKAHPDSLRSDLVPLIYQNKGVALSFLLDFRTALHNMGLALDYYSNKGLPGDDNYINLISNIGAANFNLGDTLQGLRVYEDGLKWAESAGSYIATNYILNYAATLAHTGNPGKGEKLYAKEVERLRKKLPEDARRYYEALYRYGNFLRIFNIDTKRSLLILGKCYEYVSSHPYNSVLNNNISLAYSSALLSNDLPYAALDTVNSLLFRGAYLKIPGNPMDNPDFSKLRKDGATLDQLQAKYAILERISHTRNDTTIIKGKARTSELIIDLLEDIRLNIGEEESRILLGSKNREAYLDALKSYMECYDLSGDHVFVDKAFRISERSKAAALLAAIREVKAMKAAIPVEKMDKELEIQKEISYYETKYDQEKSADNPDKIKMNLWETYLLSATGKLDSLHRELEEKYPGYTSLKTGKLVLGPADVMKLVGGNKDYLSYFVSDSSVYIFIVNKKGADLVKVKSDTTFLSLIKNFRQLLSEPGISGNATEEFRLFQEYGYRLFSVLFSPVKDKLVSDNLVISTDNLLSYFPFETLVTESRMATDLYYNKLPFLMNEYKISYVYSATLLSESGESNSSFRNRSVSFAPSYHKPIIIDSLLTNRQQNTGRLPDLLFARDEAEYVARVTSGKLFLDSLATKSNYIAQAGRFDIIHLAMHTVLNSRNPAFSGMIFYGKDRDTSNILQPYEIKSAILNAKMVVLSSCYTGAGTLYAGEGVLSLARRFIFAGSHSVVMSLWEVNDRSGTAIMKEFYRKLKMGRTKSDALREARISYLEKADMLRSHPYFWSTLVIYGDDSSLYLPTYLRLLVLFFPAALLGFIWLYFRKRR